MDPNRRALRLGLTIVLCAALLRMLSGGASLLSQPHIAAFLTYIKTGRDVRFSSSEAVFSPHFMESPPAAPKAEEKPRFTDPEQIELYYACHVEPDIESLLVQPLSWQLRQPEPTVLILHTHATESYTKSGEDYIETASWRTVDENYNMLSIGARVAQILEEKGIRVIRDTQLHDYPSYNGSYVDARSRTEALLAENPQICLVLDLHRDASGEGAGQLRTRAQIKGETGAQLMVVVGTNHEHYETNLSLGLKLHAQLESMYPGLMRPLQLRAQRFNQDLSPGALIIEVGAAGNTHREALTAAEALAEGIAALAEGTL